MYANSATGIAKLRRDGFVSIDGTGSLTTEKLMVAKGRNKLFINAKAPHGELRVEILTESGEVIDGYSAEDCIAFSGNDTAARIIWRNNDTASLPDIFRLRFIQKNAQLYSFWFSDTADGDSHGFYGAGRPDEK